MTVTLITGANKGLGYETARRLIAEGQTVYMGARDADRGEAGGVHARRPVRAARCHRRCVGGERPAEH